MSKGGGGEPVDWGKADQTKDITTCPLLFATLMNVRSLRPNSLFVFMFWRIGTTIYYYYYYLVSFLRNVDIHYNSTAFKAKPKN